MVDCGAGEHLEVTHMYIYIYMYSFLIMISQYHLQITLFEHLNGVRLQLEVTSTSLKAKSSLREGSK